MTNYPEGTKNSVLQKPLRKLEHSFQDLAQTGSHVELIYTTMSLIHLNMSTLSNPNSLCISLVFLLVYALNHLQPIPIRTLVNSGSTHCFLDSAFACEYSLPITSTSPVELYLFDGTSNNIISEVVSLPVEFPSGKCMTLDFYVTPLDSCCSLVLDHSWLICYNLLIDWVSGLISFRPLSLLQSLASVSPVETLVNPPFSLAENPLQFIPSEIFPSNPKRSHIAIINALALLQALYLSGSTTFSLQFRSTMQTKSITISKKIDFSFILEEYHEYVDVFSKFKAETLAPYYPYDLQIDLEKDSYSPVGTIYSLSKFKQEALKEFINENLTNGFIYSTSLPHGALVLFIKKKNGFLWLYVDFHRLNRITKKDRYPLSLISDLLDSPHKAHIYTKIDLRHMYHLVCIAEGDEWKTAFWTHYGAFEWSVMSFRLTNAPAAFQHFMNDVFSDLLDMCIVVYLNDILIYSDNITQHRNYIKEVLK